MANESNLSYMGYIGMTRPEFEPGDRVEHEEYGVGTVKEHPDAPGDEYPTDPRNATHVYFDNTPETTIVRVLETRLTHIE